MKTQIQNFWFRLLTNLNFWLTLWTSMFAYFFLVGILNLFFGSRLIPDFLLTIATFTKVSTILTCLIYTSFFAPKDYLLRAALLFTFAADVVLAIDNISPFGLILFCFAQYFHTSRYADISPNFSSLGLSSSSYSLSSPIFTKFPQFMPPASPMAARSFLISVSLSNG